MVRVMSTGKQFTNLCINDAIHFVCNEPVHNSEEDTCASSNCTAASRKEVYDH